MIINFRRDDLHAKATWTSERERLATFREWGWDTYVRVYLPITPSRDTRVEIRRAADAEGTVLHQTWRTPARTIEERLRVGDDWLAAKGDIAYLRIDDDFRPSRYLEVPLKTSDDFAALEHILPIDNPADLDVLARNYVEARALGEEFGFPVAAVESSGLDWLIWLWPAEEAILRASLETASIERLIDHIDRATRRRLAALFDLGVDFSVRRGWYEGTDFWSPTLFRRLAVPALERQIALARQAGVPFVYLMDSGITPLLSDLAGLRFDCLHGADPVLARVRQDLREIRAALPGKALWGGISAPEHLARGTPAATERAVEEAFAACGRTGFLLGPCATLRSYFPWENMLAGERAWRRLRGGEGR
jgi:hypothetical protein